MSLFDRIDQDPDVFFLTRQSCSENDASISLCHNLISKFNSSNGGYRIIKLDSYYDTIKFAKPPKAPDCLIIIERNGRFEIIVVELKDVSKPANLKPLSEIREKFDVVARFIEKDFPHVFIADDIVYERLENWLVVAGFDLSKAKGLFVDALAGKGLVRVGGLTAPIQVKSSGTEIC